MLTNDLGVMNPSRVQATASAGAALPAAARDAALAAVRSHFRPEFLNRLDDIVVFEPLSADTLRRHRTVH
jgi:ATP-dependent Clp protease ATP-binding subunit ClpB